MTRIPEDARLARSGRALTAPRGGRFQRRETVVGNLVFPSRGAAVRYTLLLARHQAREIQSLTPLPDADAVFAYTLPDGSSVRELGRRTRGKFHASPVDVQFPDAPKPERFDSLSEFERWLVLRELDRRGAISNLRRHPTYELLPAFTDSQGKRQRALVYEADFAYEQGGWERVEDVKGRATKEFWLKAKIWAWAMQQRPWTVLDVIPVESIHDWTPRPVFDPGLSCAAAQDSRKAKRRTKAETP